MLRRVLLLALPVLALLPAHASAATTVFNRVPCVTQPDGTQRCEGSIATLVPSFDGQPLDVNVALPKGKGPHPAIILLHGYGGSKLGFTAGAADDLPGLSDLAKQGYVAISPSDRGFGDSCGSAPSRAAYPQGCARGWVKLMDTRYEVRDFQFLLGSLADERLVSPTKIGAAGGSYGGGASLMLATLKDRTMLKSGKLIRWVSPKKHLRMRIAAAAPIVPWSDLISSLTPNGQGLDYAIAGPRTNFTPAGFQKQSWVTALYYGGKITGFYSPPGVDPEADLTSTFNLTSAGVPYPPAKINALDRTFQRYRGAYYVLDGVVGKPEAPAPLLISNGFTDDLFPVDEALRYYNLARLKFPRTNVSLYDMDFGHSRGQNKDADVIALRKKIVAWMRAYVLGKGRKPAHYVTVRTETCPKSAPSGGPFTTRTWAKQHPGQLKLSFKGTQTVPSSGGSADIATTIDPISGGGACAPVDASLEPNTANYSTPDATGRGYTLIGAPTVVAHLAITGSYPQLAERLWDVGSDGKQILVARGVLRPKGTGGRVIFQLHPGAWKVAAGHHLKLQLLGRDAPYVRPSTGTFTLGISKVTLYVPTREKKGNGLTKATRLPLPAGLKRAPK